MRGIIQSVSFVALAACAYSPVYGPGSQGSLHVKLVRTLVPDAVASDEVASGVREELARQGALAGGEGWPRVEIEVLREDEASEGIAVAGNMPVARATDVGIVARAWVVRSPGGPRERDTGDVRTVDVIATEGPGGTVAERLTASAFHTPDALRAAARRLGRKIASRLQGFTGASEEGFDR